MPANVSPTFLKMHQASPSILVIDTRDSWCERAWRQTQPTRMMMTRHEKSATKSHLYLDQQPTRSRNGAPNGTQGSLRSRVRSGSKSVEIAYCRLLHFGAVRARPAHRRRTSVASAVRKLACDSCACVLHSKNEICEEYEIAGYTIARLINRRLRRLTWWDASLTVGKFILEIRLITSLGVTNDIQIVAPRCFVRYVGRNSI